VLRKRHASAAIIGPTPKITDPFGDGLPSKSPDSAHRISQVYTARFKGLHRPCTLTLWRGRRWAVAGSHPITPFAARHRSTYREKAAMQPNIGPKSSPRRRNRLPEGGNRSWHAIAGGSQIRPVSVCWCDGGSCSPTTLQSSLAGAPSMSLWSFWKPMARSSGKKGSLAECGRASWYRKKTQVSGLRIAQSARCRPLQNFAAAIGSPACCARISYWSFVGNAVKAAVWPNLFPTELSAFALMQCQFDLVH